ncbi:MAG TPA: helix-turn-helix domain-containing protein [Candidatus Mediterraneibacter merdavium]|nr:helix-turn-helix domain-containing protein [Candidatus Mediterraneibacter merdavium]
MIKMGKRLKHLRTDNNMTQATLAQKLNLTKSVISAYENDLRLPSYDVLIQIAKIFHVSTDYLFGLESSTDVDLSGLSEDEKTALKNLILAMKHRK